MGVLQGVYNQFVQGVRPEDLLARRPAGNTAPAPQNQEWSEGWRRPVYAASVYI